MTIRNTKIWFGDDAALGEQIFKRLKELGADPQNNWKIWNKLLNNPRGYSVSSDLALGWYAAKRENGSFDVTPYTEITLKDLSINNLDMDNKKLIGWKFKDKKYSDIIQKEYLNCITGLTKEYDFTDKSEVKDRLVELNVLEIWCTPVYEEEFKVGDWVTLVPELIDKSSYNYAIYYCIQVPKTLKIKSLHCDGKGILFFLNEQSQWNLPVDCYRLATKEEIEAAEEVKIGNYFVKIVSSDQVVIDGNSYNYLDVTRVLEVLALPKVGHLMVGCNFNIKLTKETVEKILKRMKEC